MVAWPDFSHIAFENATAFFPFKNIFHDFRPLKGLFQFRPEAWALMNSFGEKWEFCSMIQQRCTGNNTQVRGSEGKGCGAGVGRDLSPRFLACQHTV
jgi:hypothetical protein